jgi:hypothetical protein
VVVPNRRATLAALRLKETGHILGRTGKGSPSILDDPGVRPACHVFVGSKVSWFEITDDLPQYAEYAPPG